MKSKKSNQQLPSFDFTWDSNHNKVYTDPNVQKVYIQLSRLSEFIGDCQIRSELEYANVSQNVSVSPDAPIKTMADYLIDLLKVCFEKIADVEFPYFGKTGGKVISYLLTGMVDEWTKKELRPDTLQDTYNEVWEGIKSAFDTAKLKVDMWHDDMETYWFTPYTLNGNTATISQLADIDYLPTKPSTSWDSSTIYVASQSRYMMAMKLVPSRWTIRHIDSANVWDQFYTRWNDSESWNGPHWQNDKETPNGGTTGWQNTFGYWMGPLEHYFFFYEGGQPAYADRPPKPYTIFRGPVNPVTKFGDPYIADTFVHNWFSDDEKWVGWKFERYELQGINGGTAPESLTTYLFKDDSAGNNTNTHGLTTRQDIFENWGMAGTKKKSLLSFNLIDWLKTIVRKTK